MTRFFVILAVLFPILTAAAETLEPDTLEATTIHAEEGRAPAQYALGEHFRSLGENREAHQWYEKAAEQGHTEAQFMASRTAIHGVDWSDNPIIYSEQMRLTEEKEFYWLQLAAEGGLAAAQVEYAREFWSGRQVESSLEEAALWFRKAAEQGHREAQRQTAANYQFGIGVDQDYAEALRWYRELGAAATIGQYYEYGLGVEQDYEEALFWYRKAAGLNPDGLRPDGTPGEDALRAGTRGSKTAFLALARFYENGWAVSANPELAMDIYRVLAEDEDRESMRHLARIYGEGNFVPRDARKSAEWAFRALRGDDMNLFDLLGMVLLPLYDPEDTAEPMEKTFHLAAEDGEAWAQWLLSGHSKYSQGDMEPDTDAALRWLEAAAEQGHPLASFALGQRYLEGDGVEQDDERAASLLYTTIESVQSRHDLIRQGSHTPEELSENRDHVVASRWFLGRGAPQGDLFSMCGLAILQASFTSQHFTEPEEIYQWAFIAEARGLPVPEQMMERLAEQFPSEAAEEGKRRAEAWLEANPE